MVNADSLELKKFGLEAGLTNYAAAYATGLLAARRLLDTIKLADTYKGIENADGEMFDVHAKGLVKQGQKKPFKAFLDVGLIRTTTGNRVFGAMKGAVDGGIYIPHNTKRFPGYHIEKKEAQQSKRGKAIVEKGKLGANFNAKEHRDHIFGLHVQNYLDLLKKEKKEKVQTQFSNWIKCMDKNKVQNLEALYKKVHQDIRKNPKHVKPERKNAPQRKIISKPQDKGVVSQDSKGKKWIRNIKTTKDEKKARAVAKIQKALSKK